MKFVLVRKKRNKCFEFRFQSFGDYKKMDSCKNLFENSLILMKPSINIIAGRENKFAYMDLEIYSV